MLVETSDYSGAVGQKKKAISLSVFVGCLEIVDLLLFLAVGLLTGWARFGDYVLTGQRAQVIVIALFIAYAIFKHVKLHDPAILNHGFTQVRRAATSTGLIFIAILMLGYLTKSAGDYSRLWVGSWLIGTFVLLTTSRYLVSHLFRRLDAQDAFIQRFVVFSSAAEIKRLENFLHRWQTRTPRSHVIAGVFVDDVDRIKKTASLPAGLIKGNIADFENWSERRSVEKAIALLPAENSRNVECVLKSLRLVSLDVNIVAGDVDEGWAAREVEKIAGLPTVRIMSRPLGDAQVILKRLFDIFVATAALLVLWPLMLLIALAIRLETPGPALFRQQRHGFNNEPFTVFKYRSMYNAPQTPGTVEQAKRNDPRVTRIGSFLRRTSLDELPQLLNVLRGDMSIVGPRPLALEHNFKYAEVVESYLARHRIKPGITGWAQVNGLRGEIDTYDKISKRVECDLYYADHWSLGFDIEIMFKTFGVLIHKNAY